MIATDLGRAFLIARSRRLRVRRAHVPAPVRRGVSVGTLSVLFHVSYNPLFVALVPRERFVEGGSIIHGSRAFSYVVGPSIGGLLVQVLTAPVTLAVDACSYVVSALFLRSIEAEEPRAEAPGKGHVVAGVRWVFGNSIVRAALGATATINFFNFAFFALFILYATRSLGISRRRSASCSAPARSAASWAQSSPAASPAGSASVPRSRSAASSSRLRCCSCRWRGTALGDPRLPLRRRVRLRASE